MNEPGNIVVAVHPTGCDTQSRLLSEYQSLMLHRRGHFNDHALASMLASHMFCHNDMPAYLGLSADNFTLMMASHFPVAQWSSQIFGQGVLMTKDRTEEMQQILELLLVYRVNSFDSTRWVAQIIASGCLADDHLWQNTGLWSRADLSVLLCNNFPELANRNIRDMKWKKFIYRLLCEETGHITCRAPSCDACIDYEACFGEED